MKLLKFKNVEEGEFYPNDSLFVIGFAYQNKKKRGIYLVFNSFVERCAEYRNPEDFKTHEGIVRNRYIFGIFKNILNKLMFFKIKTEECLLDLEDITETNISKCRVMARIVNMNFSNVSQKRKNLILDYICKKSVGKIIRNIENESSNNY